MTQEEIDAAELEDEIEQQQHYIEAHPETEAQMKRRWMFESIERWFEDEDEGMINY
jgi:vacuolar-type H+-ATPase subunit E/Vma4